MDTVALLNKCSETLDDMKAKNVVTIDLQGKTIVCDYFLVATANNDRHASAIINALIDETQSIKRKAVHKDGEGRSGWMVLDFGDVVVHIFLDHVRQKYDLESLWGVEYSDTQETEVIDELRSYS